MKNKSKNHICDEVCVSNNHQYEEYKSTIHTPTPWTYDGMGVILGADKTHVANELVGDASFIVRAVNAHDDLLRMAKTCREYIKDHGISLIDDLDDAIAQAEGK